MSTSRRDIMVHGVIAGAIGYVVVEVLFGIVDFLLGRPPFATATFLGSRLTEWVFSAAPGIAIAPALAFNTLQLVLMLGAGLLGSRLVHRSPGPVLLPFVAFVAAALAALLAAFALAAGLLGAAYAVDLAWINLTAAAAVASYLIVRPRLPPARRVKPARVQGHACAGDRGSR
jgi:hypothetical protein